MNVFLASLVLGLTVSTAVSNNDNVLKSFSKSSNQFTGDLYKQYQVDAPDNFVICPLSVEALLALIHAGSRGQTAHELSTALHLPETRQEIDQLYRELHPKLNVDSNYTLQSANKIYLKDGYVVQEQYKNTVVEVFGAAIQNINFDQKKAAADEINGWVDTNTHHKIDKLLSAEDLEGQIRAVLLNAIYFKGKWESAFKSKDTKERSFYLTKTTHANVHMMEITRDFRYFYCSNLNAKFVEVPYEGEDISMTLVLPDSIEGLPDLEKRIAEVVEEHDYNWQRIHLRLPKYKIETSVELSGTLKKLGMKRVLSPEADLSGMLEGNEGLYVDKVIHKAIIETDEEGTVAAAVTAGLVFTFSMPRPPPIPIKFYLNHPFIFFLKHKDAGVLFIGRYTKPEAAIATLEKPVAADEVERE